MAGASDREEDFSTIAQFRYNPSPPPDASFVLRLVQGVDRQVVVVLDGNQPSRVLVGKSPVCDVRLSDGEVSRRHVALEIVQSRLVVEDLDSKNGTFVNEVSVGRAHLVGGERLRIGATVFEVERNAPPAASNVSPATSFGRVYGASREMRRLFPICERLAQLDVPLIIEGETGTGKEVLAESLHERGPRADKPFVVFDCTAVPPNLMESEIFGHERGAFTGAVNMRKGVFEQAHGGTLLLDEIGDLDLALQPKLLRAIERSEVRRVGGAAWIRVDVRIMAATRRDLDHEIQSGRFRDDLYHRLAVARLELPPLRRRRGDVGLLAKRFALEFGGDENAIPASVLARWEDEAWPGNVRQLRNSVARQLALGDVAAQELEQGNEDVRGDYFDHVLREELPFVPSKQKVVREFERRYIERVLAKHGGNIVRAAQASGIARRYFQILRARQR